MICSTTWLNAVVYILEEDGDEFDSVLCTLSGWDITYHAVVYVMPDDMEDWEVWLMNAPYRDTRIQMGEPLSAHITDEQLATFIEEIELRTLGMVRKVIVGFLELRDQRTFEQLKLAIAANPTLRRHSVLEFV
jgi:hypothetical protein